MTQRSDWDNLLTALESDPHLREALRRHILTEELLNLPATVANLARHVETIALAVGQLQIDMTSVKKEMVEMRADIASVKEDVGQLQRGQNIQTGVLSEAAGAAYENTAIRLAPRLFRRHLGFTGTVLFSHYSEGRHGNLKAMAKAVPDNQTVGAEGLEDLLETDMVFTAKGPAGQDVYIVAEASLTVQASDVVRAKRRAEILNMIVGHGEVDTKAVAVVMGKTISEEAQALLIGQGGETGMVTFLMANGDAPDA